MVMLLAYGLAMLAVLMLAWGSRDGYALKLAWILALNYAGTNISIAYLGFARAPMVLTILNAIAAILIAAVAISGGGPLAVIVFTMFLCEAAVHVAFFAEHAQGDFTYYLTLNVIFIAELLTVGGASGRYLLDSWVHRGHDRLLARQRVGRHDMGKAG